MLGVKFVVGAKTERSACAIGEDPLWRTRYFFNEIETYLGVPAVYSLFAGTVQAAYSIFASFMEI